MATPEQRISRLEGAYEQVDARLGSIDNRITSVENRINSLESAMNSRFNTLYILIGGAWVTLMATIITLSLAT